VIVGLPFYFFRIDQPIPRSSASPSYREVREGCHNTVQDLRKWPREKSRREKRQRVYSGVWNTRWSIMDVSPYCSVTGQGLPGPQRDNAENALEKSSPAVTVRYAIAK
jgi:hypothetical protein